MGTSTHATQMSNGSWSTRNGNGGQTGVHAHAHRRDGSSGGNWQQYHRFCEKTETMVADAAAQTRAEIETSYDDAQHLRLLKHQYAQSNE